MSSLAAFAPAKIRIIEQRTKGKIIFLCSFEREYLLRLAKKIAKKYKLPKFSGIKNSPVQPTRVSHVPRNRSVAKDYFLGAKVVKVFITSKFSGIKNLHASHDGWRILT